jgi:periplasmic divalent cation tolerance protein
MAEMISVYVTAKDMKEAESIAEALVKERLAACASIVPKIKSLYWWKGRMEKADESLLIAKTKKSLEKRLVERIKELHSYECPCIVISAVTGGNADFLKWVEEETK